MSDGRRRGHGRGLVAGNGASRAVHRSRPRRFRRAGPGRSAVVPRTSGPRRRPGHRAAHDGGHGAGPVLPGSWRPTLACCCGCCRCPAWSRCWSRWSCSPASAVTVPLMVRAAVVARRPPGPLVRRASPQASQIRRHRARRGSARRGRRRGTGPGGAEPGQCQRRRRGGPHREHDQRRRAHRGDAVRTRHHRGPCRRPAAHHRAQHRRGPPRPGPRDRCPHPPHRTGRAGHAGRRRRGPVPGRMVLRGRSPADGDGAGGAGHRRHGSRPHVTGDQCGRCSQRRRRPRSDGRPRPGIHPPRPQARTGRPARRFTG